MARRRKSRYETAGHTIREMNKDTYRLRRAVMKYIYEAKELAPLPRITVRITDVEDKDTLAEARIKGNVIWVAGTTVGPMLRHVVFHEILHAVHGVPHDKSSKLMNPIYQKTTRAEQDRLFLYHIS